MDLQNRRYLLKRSLVALGVVATTSASPAFGASFGLGGASNGYVGRLSLEKKERVG